MMNTALISGVSYHLRLIAILATRDLVARYRESVLGLLWLILRPTLFMAAFSIVRGIVAIDTGDIPYPLSSFVAVCAWFLFTTIVTGTTPTIRRNAGIIRKMPVNRLAFPVSGAVVCVFEYLMAWLPLGALLLWYGWPVGMSLVYVPVLVLITVILGLGLGLAIASVSVFRNDIALALPYIIQVWLFLSPVIYPTSLVPDRYRIYYDLNPMVGIIEGFRSVILAGQPPDWSLMLPTAIAIVVIWSLALPLFSRFSRYFADAL